MMSIRAQTCYVSVPIPLHKLAVRSDVELVFTREKDRMALVIRTMGEANLAHNFQHPPGRATCCVRMPPSAVTAIAHDPKSAD